MEFEKALRLAEQYLTMTPRFISPKEPQGLWICANASEVSKIEINAVCLPSGGEWDDFVKCTPFFDHFPFLVIATPNALARDQLVQELRPRLPASCIYVIQDAGFRNCKSIDEYISLYGQREILSVLSGAEELPAYGLLNLAEVPPRDLTKVPRSLSRFPVLDQSIGGFFAGELCVDWAAGHGEEYPAESAVAGGTGSGPCRMCLLWRAAERTISGMDLSASGRAGACCLSHG